VNRILVHFDRSCRRYYKQPRPCENLRGRRVVWRLLASRHDERRMRRHRRAILHAMDAVEARHATGPAAMFIKYRLEGQK
jgi:hypothetical protein